MASKIMSNISRTFSNSGFSRTYSSGSKPFHFTKLQQAHNTTPLPEPATQKASKRRSGSCLGTCCCLLTGCMCFLITAAIGVGVAALILWLVLRPIHTPTYTVGNVAVSKLDYNANSHALDAAATYDIFAYNGNGKIGIQYDSITIYTSYNGVTFDQGAIPGFYQGHRENKTVPVSFATPADGFALDPSNSALLQTSLAAQDVPLLMHVDVAARLKIGLIKTPRFHVHVNCNVNIKPPTSTSPAQILKQSCTKI